MNDRELEEIEAYLATWTPKRPSTGLSARALHPLPVSRRDRAHPPWFASTVTIGIAGLALALLLISPVEQQRAHRAGYQPGESAWLSNTTSAPLVNTWHTVTFTSTNH